MIIGGKYRFNCNSFKYMPIYIDIFAGCGGLSLGLHNAGWKGLFAIEKDDMAFETLKHNLIEQKQHFAWPKWLPQTNHDIDEVIEKFKNNLKALRGKIDLVAGGPPCQGFSMAGKRQQRDARNKLIHSYIKFVKLTQPKIILFENVKGFTLGFKQKSKIGRPYSEVVLDALKNLGYKDARGELIDFSEFGVPQRRERFIIIGTLDNKADEFFNKLFKNKKDFLASKKLKANIGVGAAISDLHKYNGLIDSPDSKGFKAGQYSFAKNNYQKLLRQSIDNDTIPDSHRFVNHTAETINVYEDLLKRAERDEPVCNELKKELEISKRNITVLDHMKRSPTLMSIPDDYVHYLEPRVLTVREYARIQSFPDWFKFRGKYTTGGKRRRHEVPRYTQIGNAIPPLFAEHTGNILKELVN
jgi:DNA (cytosine-5)-methyltransferase 1